MKSHHHTDTHVQSVRDRFKTREKLNLDQEDMQRLVSDPDREVRAVLTQKVCRQIRSVDLSPREQVIVTELLKLIAKDAAAIVRRALAITLKNSPALPRQIALDLIKDVDSIAVPILSHSPVLEDEDLIEILKSKAAAKMMAITKRTVIATDLVQAIVRYGDSQIIASVAANDGAEISADLGAQMLEMYHDNDLIKESFIARRDLPTLVVEKLIHMVSEEAAIRLTEKHEIPLDVALDIAERSRERAHIDFISQSWVSRDLGALVGRLDRENRLTSRLIIRAACCGQMRFVEQALAKKAAVGLQKTSLMLHDSGPFGLKALCAQAGLSAFDYTLMRASVAIFKDLEASGTIRTKAVHQKHMLERILSLPVELGEEDLHYLVEKLDACSPAFAH